MEKKVSILNNRSVIKISGKDSLLFLNNIISNNLEKINHEELFITTILSPQGKILFDFFIIKNDDSYLIECSKNQLNDLINKLKLYSLRLDVYFEKKDLNVIVSNYFYQDEISRKDVRFKNNDVYRHFSKPKKDFKNVLGKEGNFQKNFKVYQRDGLVCKRSLCGGFIKKKNISNRSTFFCNNCQN